MKPYCSGCHIGQNALNQVKQFHEAIGVTGIALTKLDGTAKGGIIFAIAKQTEIPIRFIGVGEGLMIYGLFNADEFVDALFDETSNINISTLSKRVLECSVINRIYPYVSKKYLSRDHKHDQLYKHIDIRLPISSLEAYIHYVNQIPMLTQEEEHELAVRLQKHNELAAAKR